MTGGEGVSLPHDPGAVWDRIRWASDRMLLDGQQFRIEERADGRPLDPGEIGFYKQHAQVASLARFFRRRPGFRPRRIFEMGIWDGGSIAFWNAIFRPERHVALDLSTRGDSPAFRDWVARQPQPASIETIWGVDQSHRDVVLGIARDRLGDAPDFIVDDAAHILECLQPAFETLFPILSPGGLYLIEDWAWGHQPQFFGDDHEWRSYGAPTRLLHDIIEVAGSEGDLVASVCVEPGWCIVERGPAKIDDPLAFRLSDRIVRRPPR